jgi:putative flavoprotein involved in K+ transport
MRPGETQDEARAMPLPRSVDTAVIGAGQAGLVMSWYLQQAGREHVLLDRRELLGGGWRDRWDSFCLVTPNWTTSLPGFKYDGTDPDGFMPRDEIAARIARYAEVIDAPIQLGTEVTRLSAVEGGFRLETSAGPIAAGRVIVAAGGFHKAKIPALAQALPARLKQLHTSQYRHEDALPPGAVLIVGSGQSGVQIAEELAEAGRHVYLSVGSAGRLPRRYRGRDIVAWFAALLADGDRYGVGLPTVETLPDPRLRFAANPQLSGHGGGHDVNLRWMAMNGIDLLGHLDGVDGERVALRPDLAENLVRADRFFEMTSRPLIERYIELAGVQAPPDEGRPVEFEPASTLELDLAKAGITTVVWASGYALDFGWLDLPILDESSYPRQKRGVAEVPGLYFLGLPWMHTIGSAAFWGSGADARHIAGQMGLLQKDAAESVTA